MAGDTQRDRASDAGGGEVTGDVGLVPVFSEAGAAALTVDMQGLWRRADTHHELAIQSRGDRRNEHYLREETLMRRLIEGAALALDTVLPLSEGLSWMSRFDPHAEKPAATDDAEEARPQYGRSTANARVLGAVALGVTPLGDLGTHVPALEIGDPSFLDDVIRSFREGGGSLGGE